MISAIVSCLALLALLFGLLAWANRKQLREWLDGFIIEVNPRDVR